MRFADRPLESSHGGTVTSFPVIGLLDPESKNCNQHGCRPLGCATDHRRLSHNYIPVSGDVSDISSSFDRNELRHGSLADHLDVRSQQHLLDSRKSQNIVVDIKDNLVDKNCQEPIMGDGVILESYTALDPQRKNDHSINGYLDTNKNGPTKDISLDGEKKIDHSNGKVFSEVEDKEEADDGGPCGWGPFRLDFCQRFRSPAWFLVVLTLCGACQGMAVNGFVNTVISTIEKRYEISSTESGLIASCYDIVFVLLVIPVSYFGGHGHKPRYLGISILILGIGSFVFALPHFISGSYIVDNADDTVCKLMSNNSHGCANSAASSLSNYKYFFFLGQGLHGAGATALYTLGVTYIDENVPQRVSSFYNGIFYTGAIIGPAIGYMVGAEFLNIYTEVTVDPTTLGLDTSNPKWVGAWWIGFLISGVFGVLLSLPLLAYPSSLPGSKKYALERGKEAQAMKSTDVTGKSLGLKDCLLSIKLLLTNIPFMFINLAAAADGVLVAGFSTFMPKFIEYQFGVSAGTAALYVGLAVVPAGGGATFAGGFIVRLFNLKVRGILRLCTIMSFVLFALAFSLLMECDTGPFAGVTLSYGQTDVRLSTKFSNATFMGKALNNSCNQRCGCAEEDYFPMCGRDNVMYFSPCYAGCTSSRHDGKSKMYYNCSCVNYNVTDEDWVRGTTHMGVFGKCEYKCQWLTVFMVLFTFMIVFVFITSMPSLTATLRCVPDHQRSFGLGIQWIVARCLGSIPGPILFGKMFDLACLVWQKRCDGEGSCFFYDNHNMSINLMVLALVFSLIAALTFLIALCFYKVKSDEVTVEVNGSSKEDKSKEGINLQDLSLHKDTGVSLKDSDFIYQTNQSRPEHDSR
ncbi:solute carrier organic anion transporter family member 4A1-like isoform X4 [Biomphalaria glabrata]|uniref:Solute carrier organic anion transporter family member n=1 Tax=Biomphalaria glabrata TaxID=6526 RepID=A0A9W2Z7B2_BIOGL|nr:solute carrier organic anion transporter family member 4A1-like isoform X4 [Biomphalaria glabrata]